MVFYKIREAGCISEGKFRIKGHMKNNNHVSHKNMVIIRNTFRQILSIG